MSLALSARLLGTGHRFATGGAILYDRGPLFSLPTSARGLHTYTQRLLCAEHLALCIILRCPCRHHEVVIERVQILDETNTLIVTELSRLGRSTSEVIALVLP
jgi:hypothetical protein